MKYILTIIFRNYQKVGGDYDYVEIERKFEYSSWDDVQNVLGYLTEGSRGNTLKFAIKIKEAEDDE